MVESHALSLVQPLPRPRGAFRTGANPAPVLPVAAFPFANLSHFSSATTSPKLFCHKEIDLPPSYPVSPPCPKASYRTPVRARLPIAFSTITTRRGFRSSESGQYTPSCSPRSIPGQDFYACGRQQGTFPNPPRSSKRFPWSSKRSSLVPHAASRSKEYVSSPWDTSLSSRSLCGSETFNRLAGGKFTWERCPSRCKLPALFDHSIASRRSTCWPSPE